VTECNLALLSNDRDPAGLTVLDTPDTNAAVLGRLLPPTVNIGERTPGFGRRFK